jgi:hypothetical protein
MFAESIADKIRSLSENSLLASVADRLENSTEYGDDVDKPDDVRRRQFTGRKHRPNHNHRRKPESHHLKDELVRLLIKLDVRPDGGHIVHRICQISLINIRKIP